MTARHMRTRLTFTCDGCDDTRHTYCDEAVIVRSPGGRVLVITCPDCGAVKVHAHVEQCRLARSGGTPTVALPGLLRAGAQCDGPIRLEEIRDFADRLAVTPDGRLESLAERPGLTVVLSALWREVRDGVTP